MEKLINRNLEALRKRNGWTQKELAEKLNIPKSRVGAYEELRSVISLELAEQISDLFKIGIDKLVKEDLRKLS